MIDLIRTDLFKIVKSKLIRILFCIAAMSAILMCVFAHLIASGDTDIQSSGLMADSQIFTLLGCVVIGMFLCNDFEYKIIENAISCGHRRFDIVVNKLVILTFLVTLLSLPYILALLFVSLSNLQLSLYIPTAYLSIITFATTGASITQLSILCAITILMYSAQLSIGILIMFAFQKPVVVVALTYVIALLLGPISSLSEVSKNIMSYTPFGINYTNLISDFDTTVMIQPILSSIIFMSIIIGLSYLSFRKSEVK